MEDLTLDHLTELSLQSATPAVSIYMPTHRAGPETRQNPIRFKNLVQDAYQQLLDRGLNPREADGILAPAQALLDNYPFWQHQREGLALYVAENDFHYHRLPFEAAERAVVSRSYYIKPVLPLFTNNGHYYILAVSQDEVRLFEGTRHTVGQIDLPDDTPENIQAVMPSNSAWQRGQIRTASSRAGAVGGDSGDILSGVGEGDEVHKERLGRYFNMLDRALKSLYANWRAPLVLAGVDYLLPIYRENSEYANIMPEGITGSPEHLRPDELQQQAWPIVEPYFRKETEAAIEEYGQGAAIGQATDDLAAAMTAANAGRVSKLFLAIDAQAWGDYDEQTGELRHVQDEQGADDDLALLDYIAITVLRKDGVVFVLPKEEMPTDSTVAAVLRW